MTVKEFFKSTTFKCICVLLSILLVCGIFLTIMYGLLEVTDGERLERSISKVYSGMDAKVEVNSAGDPVNYADGTVTIDSADITSAYKVSVTSNGKTATHYLVTSTGKEGYDNGTVTCSVAVIVANNAVAGIYKVSIQSNVGQSFIGRVGQDALDEFVTLYKDDITYSQEMITGATVIKTKNAICNAVNGAISFVNQEILGIAAVNKFEGFINPQSGIIDSKTSDFTVDNGVVSYTLYAKYGYTSNFEIKIVIKSEDDPVIESLTYTDGSTMGYGSYMTKDWTELFAGKTLDYFTTLLGADWAYPGDNAGTELSTGATNSNYTVAYACAFALANYENCLNAEVTE